MYNAWGSKRLIGQLKTIWLRGWKIGLAVIVVVIILQLLYPRDHTLPFAKLGNERVGYTKQSDLQARLDHAFMAANVAIKTPAKSSNQSLSKLGATNKSAATAGKLVRYPLWARLLPTSVVWYRPSVKTFDLSFDTAALTKASTTLASDLSTQPVDAGLAVKDNQLVFTAAKPGYSLTATTLAVQLRATRFGFTSTTVQANTKRTQPTYSDADFDKVRAEAEKAVASPLILVAPQKQTFTIDKPTLTSWLAIKKSDNHTVSLGLNEKAVTAYLAGIDKKIGIAAKPTQVQLRDGVETARQNGTPGSAINTTDALKKITTVLMSDADRTATLVMQPVAPPTNYTRSYSSSQAGLQAYVNYITSAEDVHIALKQLDGAGWSASARASDSVVSASTYKLYVSMMLFSRIDSGKSHWSDQMQGTTARTCFDQMIVQSLNNCAEDWIKQFGGGSAVNTFLYGKGISHATTFTASDATHTSANDLLTTLLGLHNGTLYKGSNRDILLGDMGRQIYRKGVPAGSKGTVQDKVGFLWDYNHDAALVHTPNGSYAVAIMTKGQSFDEIATITRQLEAIMYP